MVELNDVELKEDPQDGNDVPIDYHFLDGKHENDDLKTFALTSDVSEAHGRVRTDRTDRYLLGCQVRHRTDVYVNTFGTLGVASASYCGSRVSSALERISQDVTRARG